VAGELVVVSRVKSVAGMLVSQEAVDSLSKYVNRIVFFAKQDAAKEEVATIKERHVLVGLMYIADEFGRKPQA
jgi:hypothetical protein